MSFEVDFSEPWLETLPPEPSPTGVPQIYPVSIAGRVFPVVNTSFEPYRRDAFRHRSIQAQRQSIDLTNVPGEGTVNTEGLWRRACIDWHLGSGQAYFDRKGSDPARFEESKGINPWTPWQASLLNDTYQVLPANAGTQVLQVGQYLYVLDTGAGTLTFTSNLLSWTTVTGLGANPIMLASDGYDLWIADNTVGGPGLYSTTAGATSAASYVTGVRFDGVWWVNQRLMTSSGPNVYNITAGGAYPGALFTHPNANWRVTAMAGGSSQIYIGGYDPGGGNPLASAVFRTTLELPAATNLTVPVQALPLENGEYVTSLYGYLNFMFVGTNLGVRMCRTLAAYDPTGNQGDLEAGPVLPNLISPGPVNLPVHAMTANNRYLWFGWSNYDGVSTGLGRMDLSTFIDTQAPAYASDLMVTGQGEIVSMDWCTINNQPIWSVYGGGVYTSLTTPVPLGYVDSGYVSYGIPDDKILMAGDIGTVTPQQGTATMGIGSDANDNTIQSVGAQQSSANGGTTNQSVFPINQIRGEQFTVRMTLTADPQTNQSPIVHRWTIKALPAVTAGTTISVVLNLSKNSAGSYSESFIDPYEVKAFFENIRSTVQVVEYVEGPYSTLATIEEIDWLPFKQRDADLEGGYEGDMIVYLKTWDIGS